MKATTGVELPLKAQETTLFYFKNNMFEFYV